MPNQSAGGCWLVKFACGELHITIQACTNERAGAGLLDLHSVCGEVRWLRWALQLQATLDSLFWDSTAGELQIWFFRI